MDKQQKGYEAFIAELAKQWQQTEQFQGQRLARLIDKVEAYMAAASDLTQDELALISEYVKRDLLSAKTAQSQPEQSLWALALADSAWAWLSQVTDRTQVEWQELKDELAHKGIYHSGEWVGLGVMVCQRCQHVTTILHPQALAPCLQCGYDQYQRQALAP